jgi:hypothetical protein
MMARLKAGCATCKRSAAREKLNCMTTTQAVAKAVSQQLI